MNQDLLNVINEVRANKKLARLTTYQAGDRLREQLGFESLDLAELTVRIEDKFGVDVFSDGLVQTVGEIQTKLARASKA